MVKFDRKGYKRRTRLLILTNKSLCLNQILKNKLKPKEKIPLDFIKKLEVTSGRDNFLLIRISPEYKHNKVYTLNIVFYYISIIYIFTILIYHHNYCLYTVYVLYNYMYLTKFYIIINKIVLKFKINSITI